MTPHDYPAPPEEEQLTYDEGLLMWATDYYRAVKSNEYDSEEHAVADLMQIFNRRPTMTPQEEIAALKARIAELEKDVWPSVGDVYCYLCDDGTICSSIYQENSDLDAAISQGNVFLNLPGAERERDRRAVTTELRKLAKGFVPDWKDSYQEKWFPAFDDGKAEAHGVCCKQYSTLPHFRTEADLEAAIAALGDRINVLFDGGV